MSLPSECSRPETAAAEDRPDDPLEVLIVEDSEDDALLAIDALRGGGFAPRWRRVENAAEMRLALGECAWQVVLADHSLPGFSALEAFEIYRQAQLDIPFLIVSDVIGEEVAVAAMKAGVHDYLRKGKLARLAPAVRRELREAGIRRERTRVAAALHATYSELAAIHANAPVALLVVDEQLRVERANELAARLAGRQSTEMVGLSYGAVFRCPAALDDPRGCGYRPGCAQCSIRAEVSAILHATPPPNRVETSARVSMNGKPEDRWFLVSCGRIESAQGPRALVCAQDITDLKQAQFDLQQQRDAMELQAHLINLSHDAIIVADADRTIRGWNMGAQELYGWTAEQARGGVLHCLLQTASADSIAEIDRRLLQDGRWEGEVSHTRQDGRPILSDSRQVLLRDTEGKTLAILEINRDITERRRAEETLKQTVRALESALAEKTVLLKEIHHRVKNNLAVIASLLSMKASATRSAEARQALKTSQERVHSMALIHEHLYGSGHLDRINFSEYARVLVQELQSAFVGEQSRIAIELALDPIELGIERAVPCALILNELLSNALKHAFPGGRRGRIGISFREAHPGWLELAIEDDGVGLPAGLAGREGTKSLGLRIVSILTSQLDGTLEQEQGRASGTRIVIRFRAQAGQAANAAAG